MINFINKIKKDIQMKKSLVTLFALLTILFSSLTFSSPQVQAKSIDPDETVIRVYQNGVWINYIYGPGGKIVNVYVESLG
jgi:hypothetical protein